MLPAVLMGFIPKPTLAFAIALPHRLGGIFSSEGYTTLPIVVDRHRGMLFPHKVFVNGTHLIAGLFPVVFSSFFDRFLWNSAQHQAAYADNSSILAFLDHWVAISHVGILVCTYRFPPLTELRVYVGLVVITTKVSPDPTMLITSGCFGRLLDSHDRTLVLSVT